MQSGNEILLNLDNYEHLADSELVSGLIELAKRDSHIEHNWNAHPTTERCLRDLKERMPRMKATHIAQIQLILQRLGIMDTEMWELNSHHTLRLLHLYKARDLAQFLDVFDAPVTNHIGDEITLTKAPEVFYERVIGILPMHVKSMTQHQVIRVLEVMNNRNIGS